MHIPQLFPMWPHWAGDPQESPIFWWWPLLMTSWWWDPVSAPFHPSSRKIMVVTEPCSSSCGFPILSLLLLIVPSINPPWIVQTKHAICFPSESSLQTYPASSVLNFPSGLTQPNSPSFKGTVHIICVKFTDSTVNPGSWYIASIHVCLFFIINPFIIQFLPPFIIIYFYFPLPVPTSKSWKIHASEGNLIWK